MAMKIQFLIIFFQYDKLWKHKAISNIICKNPIKPGKLIWPQIPTWYSNRCDIDSDSCEAPRKGWSWSCKLWRGGSLCFVHTHDQMSFLLSFFFSQTIKYPLFFSHTHTIKYLFLSYKRSHHKSSQLSHVGSP